MPDTCFCPSLVWAWHAPCTLPAGGPHQTCPRDWAESGLMGQREWSAVGSRKGRGRAPSWPRPHPDTPWARRRMAGSWATGWSDPCLRCLRSDLQRTGIGFNTHKHMYKQKPMTALMHMLSLCVEKVTYFCNSLCLRDSSETWQPYTKHVVFPGQRKVSSHLGQRALGFSTPSHHGAETTDWWWHEFLSSLQSLQCCRGAQKRRESGLKSIELISYWWSQVDDNKCTWCHWGPHEGLAAVQQDESVAPPWWWPPGRAGCLCHWAGGTYPPLLYCPAPPGYISAPKHHVNTNYALFKWICLIQDSRNNLTFCMNQPLQTHTVVYRGTPNNVLLANDIEHRKHISRKDKVYKKHSYVTNRRALTTKKITGACTNSARQDKDIAALMCNKKVL